MHIRVLAVEAGSPPVVRCIINGVVVAASWRGSSAPTVGLTTDVELEVPSELRWGESLILQAEQRVPDCVHGVIEDVEGEAVTLRIGTSPVLIEVLGEPPLGAVGTTVVVKAGLDLYPTGV